MNYFEQIYKARYSETDSNGRLKLKSFLDYAQEIAGEHVAVLGASIPTMREHHRAWLLSRIKLRINSYPGVGEQLRVVTYPAGFDRLFARREFRFYNEQNDCVAEATSLWLLVDMQLKKILVAQREVGALISDNSETPIAFDSLGKLPTDDGTNVLLRCAIRDTQIDLNGHLNNAEYAGLIQDTLGAGCYPHEFQINYQKAILPRSDLVITGDVTTEHFIFTGRVDGSVAFECNGTFA